MTPHQDNFPWEYLRNASVRSLESFELTRLSHAANLRKEIASLVDEWVDESANAMICFAPPLCTAMSCRNLLRVVRFTVILFDLAARSTLCSWGLCTTVSAVVLDLPLPEIHSLSVPAPSGGHARGLALPLLVPAALSRSYSLTPIPTRYVNGSIYNL